MSYQVWSHHSSRNSLISRLPSGPCSPCSRYMPFLARQSCCRLRTRIWTTGGALALFVQGVNSLPRKSLSSGEIRVLDQPSHSEKEAAHVPVLLREVLTQFEDQRLRSFVDCTLGAGGHAAAIICAHPEMEVFVGMDVDPHAHKEAHPRLKLATESRASQGSDSDLKVFVRHANFRNVKNVLEVLDPLLATRGVDGILMDLGVSSMQVNRGERGFSFMRDGPVDMRMDPTGTLTAEVILNTWPESEIGRILRDYGDERRWRHLARRIVQERLSGGITSTSRLVEIIGGSSFTRTKGKSGRLKPAIHPATRTFQALRIAVNDELKSLELALADAFGCLSSGGRLQVISFHSLEDRIVKQFFLNFAEVRSSSYISEETEADPQSSMREYVHIPGETRYSNYSRRRSISNDDLEKNKNVIEGRCAKILTKKPILPSHEEMANNIRCRSAKLRIIEKL